MAEIPSKADQSIAYGRTRVGWTSRPLHSRGPLYDNAGMRSSLLCLILVCGCAATPSVQVHDEQGKPVEGARVTVVKASMNSIQGQTDKKGEVEVISEGRWIRVEKKGYSRAYKQYPEKWPLKIVLEKQEDPFGKRGPVMEMRPGVTPTTVPDQNRY